MKDQIPNRNIDQPLPFSCSWTKDFPINKWDGHSQAVDVDGRRTILMEICIFQSANILPTSFPNYDVEQMGINHEQMEVVLPPCQLLYQKTRLHTIQTSGSYRGDTGPQEGKPINIDTYVAYPKTCGESIDRIGTLAEATPMDLA